MSILPTLLYLAEIFKSATLFGHIMTMTEALVGREGYWKGEKDLAYINLLTSGQDLRSLIFDWPKLPAELRELVLSSDKYEIELVRAITIPPHFHMRSASALINKSTFLGHQAYFDFGNNWTATWAPIHKNQVMVAPPGTAHGFRTTADGPPLFLIAINYPPIADRDTYYESVS